MRLLDRYLLRELMVPFGYCLSGFFMFWTSFDLLDELESFQRQKLRGLDIAEYYFFKTPEMLGTVVPIALLLALLYALTHLARHHELTAIRTAGVSLSRLALPYLAVGLVLSLGLFAVSEWWAPQSADAADEVRSRRTTGASQAAPRNVERKLGFTNAREKRHWLILAYNLVTYEMSYPHVTWELPDGSRKTIDAERAFRQEGVWVFTNVQILVYPLGGALVGPAWETNLLAFPEFSETPEEIKSEIKVNKIRSLRQARRVQLSVREIMNYKRLHPDDSSKYALLDTKLHGRLAAPWTCLVVVVIALPFGAAAGRRNVFVGVSSSILICFTYFVLQQLSLALGTGGYAPPWLAAWAPNVCFAAAGMLLSWRIR